VLKYESVLHGEVKKPGLGPLHTEFDGKGFAYTSMFVTSEIVKWNIETLEVVDRTPTFYSVGHMTIPGGCTAKPHGKYAIAYNKITKDRYLPTGPELTQSAQLYDISGDKMKLLLDFPTVGEPHYAEAIPAELIARGPRKSTSSRTTTSARHQEREGRPRRARGQCGARLHDRHPLAPRTRQHRGHQGRRRGLFPRHQPRTGLGRAPRLRGQGRRNSELLIMPGETITLKWTPNRVGIAPFYCTDFCSALHQEMQGYDGLNHYIGMKAIEPDTIPELKVMRPGIVAMALLGLRWPRSGGGGGCRVWAVALVLVGSLVGLATSTSGSTTTGTTSTWRTRRSRSPACRTSRR
jgi:nitrous-oxide reductase